MINKVSDLLQKARRKGLFISVNNDQLSIKHSSEKNPDPDLLQEIKDNKEIIIDFLKNKSKIKNDKIYENQIVHVEKNSVQHIPLSFSQERLWFIDQLEGSIQYHIPAVWYLKGELNKEALANALKNIVNRHEVLRTVILDGDQAYQSVMDIGNWHLETIEGLTYTNHKEDLQKHIQNLIRKPFDLSKDFMFRAHLISLIDQEYVLLITMHHIASDGWSTSILIRELVEFYNAYCENRLANLPPLPVQYSDYAIWQRNYLHGEVLDKEVEYWKEKLKEVSILQLPTDHQRPAEYTNRGALLRFNIDKLLSDQLRSLSRNEGATLFMTLLAAFKILLHRYSGQEDICVGTPIANRTQKEIEGLIGFFVNTLALRSKVDPTSSFKVLLEQVKTNTMEDYEHQNVPFEKVVEATVKERDMSRNPLFQVMLVMQNNPKVQALSLGEVQLSIESTEHETAQFDISFTISETDNGLRGSVEYATDLYDEVTIQRMIGHFETLLDSIVKDPLQKIDTLKILTPVEEHQLLVEFNDTKVDFPKDKTVVSLFEEQAAKTPEAIAVVFEKEQLSYKQLNEKANQLAHYLRSVGVREETLVPIYIERGLEMIIGILAILKSGGAYVPIDPEYPQERIKFMLGDTGGSTVVSSKQRRLDLENIEDIKVIEIDNDWCSISTQPTKNLDVKVKPDNLAYVIYTSGSTGTPKGVMIEHASLINYVLSFADYFSINSKDVVLQQSSISFDTSAEEIYPTLISGGCVCLIKEGGKDIDSIKNYIENEGATILSTTPMVIEWLNNETLSTTNLRYLISGGDVLHSSNINNLFQKVPIVNGYGPSETTVAATFKKIDKISEASLIGKPFPNIAIYILDQHDNLNPISVVGEICIGGAGLARGYLNNPDLTNKKFIPNPFVNKTESRIYRTGDYGKWLADGNIEYIGRLDNQVKIRGYRIELGEIETLLQQSGLISQAIVMVRKDSNGNDRLVGYLVPSGILNLENVKSYLRSRVPDYMIPTIWLELESMPLTPSGKIDKNSFPEFDSQNTISEEYIAPRNETEKMIAEIWEQVLNLEKVGVNNNFFELGGHSLVILKLASKIREKGLKIEIKDFFKYQTIEQQSNFIKTSIKLLDTAGQGKFVIPIQPEGTNIPLFAIPEFLLYAEIGKYISKKQPFYSIEHSPYDTVTEVVNHYITEIKKTHPHGPYGLMGYCGWGDIILEMAKTLIANGDEVPVLILSEYYSPTINLSRVSFKYIRQKLKFITKKLFENGTSINKRKFLSNQFAGALQFINKKFKNTGKISSTKTKTYSGKVILLQASDTLGFKDDAHMGWDIFTGEVKKFIIESDHLGMMISPAAAKQIAEILNKELLETSLHEKEI